MKPELVSCDISYDCWFLPLWFNQLLKDAGQNGRNRNRCGVGQSRWNVHCWASSLCCGRTADYNLQYRQQSLLVCMSNNKNLRSCKNFAWCSFVWILSVHLIWKYISRNFCALPVQLVTINQQALDYKGNTVKSCRLISTVLCRWKLECKTPWSAKSNSKLIEFPCMRETLSNVGLQDGITIHLRDTSSDNLHSTQCARFK